MIKIQVTGLQEYIKALEVLSDEDFTQKLAEDAAAMLLYRIRKRYLAKIDPDNIKWKPSLAGKIRELKGLPGTLFDTGTLFHSIQAYSPERGVAAIGTDVPYGKQHNEGITGVLPQREFLGFSDEDITLVERLIIKRLDEALS